MLAARMWGEDDRSGSAQRVLITDAETRAVVAAARGLRAAGFTVIAAAAESARPAPAHWSRSVAERLLVPHPLENEAAFVQAIERSLASARGTLLMPGSDASLLALSAAYDVLEPHAPRGLQRREVVERCLEKPALAWAASRRGLESPPMAECSTNDEAIRAAREFGLPVLVKPIRSIVERAGTRRHVGSVRVNDEVGVTMAARLLGDRYLIQQIEEGAVLSFAGVFAGGRLLGEALSRYGRTWYPEAGNVSFSQTVPVPEDLRERVIGLLEELDWEGLFELELIEREDGGWAAIDLNPRPYGSLALAIGAGANLPALWCAHVLEEDPAPVSARHGVRYRWEDADLRHGLWQARQGKAREAAAVLRVHRGVVHAYFATDDPGPLAARTVFLAKATWRRAATRRSRLRQDVRDPDAFELPVPPRPGPGMGGRHPLPMVVVGAGPYGIATAGYLRAAGLPVRCFGSPFSFWQRHMPTGMILRSPRRATHIADPSRRLTIDQHEREVGRKYREPTLTLDEFIDYGTWFQRLAVPNVDERLVSEVHRADGAFGVTIEDGEQLEASRVIVAAGLAPFGRHPQTFESLPTSLVSHASDHGDLGVFAGKRVVVIGAGQSALESAALLSEHGAAVEVLARTSEITWLGPDHQPARATRTVRIPIPPPPTAVGGRVSGWLAATPDLFRRTPAEVQVWAAARCIRPAGSGWLRPRLAEVTLSCGRFATRAEARNGGVWLELNDGSERVADHVLLGTGYEIDVRRYPFLSGGLLEQLDTVAGYPRLGPGLESSVAGLHFVGAPAAWSFGPVMRFVVGTWYAAPAVARRALDRRQPPLRFAF